MAAARPLPRCYPKMRPVWTFLLLGALLTFLCTTCGKPARPMAKEARAGLKVYQSVCVACHNVDPRFPGATGPELQGASADLIRTKARDRAYPPGHVPKRLTRDMPAFPLTDGEVMGLHAFLNHPR